MMQLSPAEGHKGGQRAGESDVERKVDQTGFIQT